MKKIAALTHTPFSSRITRRLSLESVISQARKIITCFQDKEQDLRQLCENTDNADLLSGLLSRFQDTIDFTSDSDFNDFLLTVMVIAYYPNESLSKRLISRIKPLYLEQFFAYLTNNGFDTGPERQRETVLVFRCLESISNNLQISFDCREKFAELMQDNEKDCRTLCHTACQNHLQNHLAYTLSSDFEETKLSLKVLLSALELSPYNDEAFYQFHDIYPAGQKYFLVVTNSILRID